MFRTAFTLALLTSSTASAAGFDVLDRVAISGQPGHFSESGVGSPSAAADEIAGEMVVAFETQVGAADAACPEGRWAVGLASSADGTRWTYGDAPALAPSAALPCGARSPSVLADLDGRRTAWAERVVTGADCRGACPSDNGIVEVHIRGLEAATAPSVVLPFGGQPSVVRDRNVHEMYLTIDGDLWQAYETAHGGWMLAAEPSLTKGEVDWTSTRLASPSVSCGDDGDQPYELHFTGVGHDGISSLSGWSDITSEDGVEFDLTGLDEPHLQLRLPAMPTLSVVRTTTGGRVAFVELPGRMGTVIGTLVSGDDHTALTRAASLHCNP